MSVLVVGKNDLETYCKSHALEYLLSEWDYAKNDPITPKSISYGSANAVWWVCDKGHSYKSIVGNKVHKKYKCPYCSNKRVLPGFNDLASFCRANGKEYLLTEWDYEKNKDLTPSLVTKASNKPVWWICPEGHSYDSKIESRAIKGAQCPFCSSQKLLSGFNDLATRRPEVAALWDYERNKDLRPTQVMAFANRRVFWKCSDCGNRWEGSISTTKKCPKCSDNYKVSESENIIFYYLSQYFIDTELTYHATWLGKREIDIYIPSIKVAVEYDGEFWHRKILKRDLEKSERILKQGILLVRLREEKLESIADGSIHISVPTTNYSLRRLNEPLGILFDVINKHRGLAINPDIDVDRDWKKILAKAANNKRERSVLAVFPEIAKTWNYEKNDGLKPENFLPGSNKSVWWKCPDCDFEWEEIIVNRIKRHKPCSKCGREDSRRLIPGLNDLLSKYPEIAAEWNYDKNEDLKPENFTYGSTKNVWWRCKTCNKEWQSTIANRSTGFGCPVCGRKKAAESFSKHHLKKGENDLLTINPFVAQQWDYEKNKGITPDGISAHSNKPMWWKCQVCNNSWEATVASRAKAKSCPFCSNRRFKTGFNDVFTIAPVLALEWDYTKNEGYDPKQLICTSPEKVWWKCPTCDHSWQAEIRRRTKGSGCPECGKQKGVVTRTVNKHKSGNTLSKMCPEVAAEWHPTKNGDLSPNTITFRNGQKVWWLCSNCGCEWEATVKHRTNGTGCPNCANKDNGKVHAKKVINLDTMEVFDSISEAARRYKVSISAISVCLGGRTKKAGNPKCRWSYYD